MTPIADIPEALKVYDLIIGFDTEYRREVVDGTMPERGNRLVSYQVAIINPLTGAHIARWFPPDGKRKVQRRSLSFVLMSALMIAMKGGVFDIAPGCLKLKLALVGHYTRADLCGLADFSRLKKKVSYVRGTFCTIERPIPRDILLPGGRRLKASITLYDTMLLTPAGARSVAAIGAALGEPKLSVPDVINEEGLLVRGIERMDLVLKQHPGEFGEYAVQDARIAALWLIEAARVGRVLGLTKMKPTIAAMAVESLITRHAASDLALTLGHEMTAPKTRGTMPKMKGRPLPEVAAIQSICADAFHGGRNEAYMHGEISGINERPLVDYDLKGAYATAMAALRPLDWSCITHTKDLDQLATLNALTVATVDFEFPPSTRFPSLPVDAGERGLLYPLTGRATVVGPELMVALSQDAKIGVRAGVRVDWLDEDGARPFALFTREINHIRASHVKGSPIEQMAKEAGNSLYGKTAQDVGGMKPVPVRRRHFNSRTGDYVDIGPSKITSPLLAAYTSGLTRAVLSEILTRLPDGAQVVSATTDGFLCDATPTEVAHAYQGEVACYFSSLRARVDPKGSTAIIEIKHQALSVLSCRTRTAFTITSFNGSEPICARGGHRANTVFADRAAEIEYWIDLVRRRQHGTRIKGRVFKSVYDQWHNDADLIEVERAPEVALDFDFKRRANPETITLRAGLLFFNTLPWSSVDEFHAYRNDLERWRKQAKRIVKTVDDLDQFQQWRGTPRQPQRGGARRSSFRRAVMIAHAKGLPGFPVRRGPGRRVDGTTQLSLEQIARLLNDCGVEAVTVNVLRHAQRREPDPRDNPVDLLGSDLPVLNNLLQYVPSQALEPLLTDRARQALRARLVKNRTAPKTKRPRKVQAMLYKKNQQVRLQFSLRVHKPAKLRNGGRRTLAD